MKIACPEHGAHFGDEIAELMECKYIWQRWNMQDLPVANRREILDWYLTMPADKTFIETGYGIACGLSAEYIGYDQALASSTEYREMSDIERREWQRQVIKEQYAAAKRRPLWKRLLRR